MASLLAQEIIRLKRDGAVLAQGEINSFVEGLTNGAIGDGQVAAFAMAVFFRGMDAREAADLTAAMTASGRRLDWRAPDLPGPVLDKHSTGGIGDNVSLILAPAVAACGGFVPMIAGRGLGHTGGTVDKLESIPGYRTDPDLAAFQRIVRETGCAIVGQSADLAPADRRLYAVRDVTATVESIPLITASILSKKLAAGLAALTMDVKTGNGAFMPSLEAARALAHALVATGAAAGLPTRALITDMNEPLAPCAGNAIEVLHAIDFLAGRRADRRLRDIVVALGADMLTLGRLAPSLDDAARDIEDALDSGAAAERFARMVAALGGPRDLLEARGARLPAAPVVRDIFASGKGYVARIDTRALGLAVVALGGGRRNAGDAIDRAVGFSETAPIGTPVGDRPLAIVHARDEAQAEAAGEAIRRSFVIEDAPPAPRPVVIERLTTPAA